MATQQFTFTVADIVAATGRNPDVVRRDIRTGSLKPVSFRDLVRYTAGYMLVRRRLDKEDDAGTVSSDGTGGGVALAASPSSAPPPARPPLRRPAPTPPPQQTSVKKGGVWT